ncbi:MAG: type II toxin-antitoxin system HigB family toxin [Bacteroidales bacterium]|nr:type II toxin-antitoxin system HigB family toxin [Bacteroidales bacterium]
MIIIGTDILERFIKKHAEMKNAVLTWKETVEVQSWENPHNVKDTCPKASNIGNKEWWFDLNYGGYRLLATIDFYAKIVFIDGIYSHKKYMKISNQATAKKRRDK